MQSLQRTGLSELCLLALTWHKSWFPREKISIIHKIILFYFFIPRADKRARSVWEELFEKGVVWENLPPLWMWKSWVIRSWNLVRLLYLRDARFWVSGRLFDTQLVQRAAFQPLQFNSLSVFPWRLSCLIRIFLIHDSILTSSNNDFSQRRDQWKTHTRVRAAANTCARTHTHLFLDT